MKRRYKKTLITGLLVINLIGTIAPLSQFAYADPAPPTASAVLDSTLIDTTFVNSSVYATYEAKNFNNGSETVTAKGILFNNGKMLLYQDVEGKPECRLLQAQDIKVPTNEWQFIETNKPAYTLKECTDIYEKLKCSPFISSGINILQEDPTSMENLGIPDLSKQDNEVWNNALATAIANATGTLNQNSDSKSADKEAEEKKEDKKESILINETNITKANGFINYTVEDDDSTYANAIKESYGASLFLMPFQDSLSNLLENEASKNYFPSLYGDDGGYYPISYTPLYKSPADNLKGVNVATVADVYGISSKPTSIGFNYFEWEKPEGEDKAKYVTHFQSVFKQNQYSRFYLTNCMAIKKGLQDTLLANLSTPVAVDCYGNIVLDSTNPKLRHLIVLPNIANPHLCGGKCYMPTKAMLYNYAPGTANLLDGQQSLQTLQDNLGAHLKGTRQVLAVDLSSSSLFNNHEGEITSIPRDASNEGEIRDNLSSVTVVDENGKASGYMAFIFGSDFDSILSNHYLMSNADLQAHLVFAPSEFNFTGTKWASTKLGFGEDTASTVALLEKSNLVWGEANQMPENTSSVNGSTLTGETVKYRTIGKPADTTVDWDYYLKGNSETDWSNLTAENMIPVLYLFYKCESSGQSYDYSFYDTNCLSLMYGETESSGDDEEETVKSPQAGTHAYAFLRAENFKAEAGLASAYVETDDDGKGVNQQQDAQDVVSMMKAYLSDLGGSISNTATMTLSEQYKSIQDASSTNCIFHISEIYKEPWFKNILKLYVSVLIGLNMIWLLLNIVGMVTNNDNLISYGIKVLKAIGLSCLPVFCLIVFITLCNLSTAWIFNNTFNYWTVIRLEVGNLNATNLGQSSSMQEAMFLKRSNKPNYEKNTVLLKVYSDYPELSESEDETTPSEAEMDFEKDVSIMEMASVYSSGDTGLVRGFSSSNSYAESLDDIHQNVDRYDNSIYYYFYDVLRTHFYNYEMNKGNKHLIAQGSDFTKENGMLNTRGDVVEMLTDPVFIYGKDAEELDLNNTNALEVRQLKVQDLCGLTPLFSQPENTRDLSRSYYDDIKTSYWYRIMREGSNVNQYDLIDGSINIVLPENYTGDAVGNPNRKGVIFSAYTQLDEDDEYLFNNFESALNEVNQKVAEDFMTFDDYKKCKNETILESAALMMTLEFNQIMSRRLKTNIKLQPQTHQGNSFNMDLVMRSLLIDSLNNVDANTSLSEDIMRVVENKGGTMIQVLVYLTGLCTQLAGVMKCFLILITFILSILTFNLVYNIGHNFFNKAYIGLLGIYGIQLIIHLAYLIVLRMLCTPADSVVQASLFQGWSSGVKIFLLLLLAVAQTVSLALLTAFMTKHVKDLGGQIIMDRATSVFNGVKGTLNGLFNSDQSTSSSNNTTLNSENIEIDNQADTSIDSDITTTGIENSQDTLRAREEADRELDISKADVNIKSETTQNNTQESDILSEATTTESEISSTISESETSTSEETSHFSPTNSLISNSEGDTNSLISTSEGDTNSLISNSQGDTNSLTSTSNGGSNSLTNTSKGTISNIGGGVSNAMTGFVLGSGIDLAVDSIGDKSKDGELASHTRSAVKNIAKVAATKNPLAMNIPEAMKDIEYIKQKAPVPRFMANAMMGDYMDISGKVTKLMGEDGSSSTFNSTINTNNSTTNAESSTTNTSNGNQAVNKIVKDAEANIKKFDQSFSTKNDNRVSNKYVNTNSSTTTEMSNSINVSTDNRNVVNTAEEVAKGVNGVFEKLNIADIAERTENSPFTKE